MPLQKISFEYDIPEGYRFVRIGSPISGEKYLSSDGSIKTVNATFNLTCYWIIVEKIQEKENSAENQNRRKHADLIHAWAEGAEIQFQRNDGTWEDVQSNNPVWNVKDTYRIKPKTKTIRFRAGITKKGDVITYQYGRSLVPNFKQWLGDWQEVEIEE